MCAYDQHIYVFKLEIRGDLINEKSECLKKRIIPFTIIAVVLGVWRSGHYAMQEEKQLKNGTIKVAQVSKTVQAISVFPS